MGRNIDTLMNNAPNKASDYDTSVHSQAMDMLSDTIMDYSTMHGFIITEYFSHDNTFIKNTEDKDMMVCKKHGRTYIPVFIIKILSSTSVMDTQNGDKIGIVDGPIKVMDEYNLSQIDGIIINGLFWNYYKVERRGSKLLVEIDQSNKNNFHELKSYKSLREIAERYN